MRLMFAGSILLVAASSAFADLVPVDPHIIYASGGDATPIGTEGISINLSNGGGGIFVFQNDTGVDLSNLDVRVQFPFAVFPNGFTLDDTIFVPTGGQQSTFSSAQFNMVTCADLQGFSSSTACLDMKFGLVPGPLVGIGQNFVLDFDFPLDTIDASVANGTYTGGTLIEGRNGDWPSDALVSVTPIPAVPEPRYAGLILAGLATLVYRQRRYKAAR